MESSITSKRLPKTIEQHEADERRIAEFTKEAEVYWNATTPYGAPAFDVGRGLELLLYEVTRYSEALRLIEAKADEQETLIKHRELTGQEVTDADRQRWFAYSKVARIAHEALSHYPPPNSVADQPA